MTSSFVTKVGLRLLMQVDVSRIWNNLYQRRLINAVADELLSLSLNMDWQGRLAHLIRRLMSEGNYDDAMQVAACASARFEHEEWLEITVSLLCTSR